MLSPVSTCQHRRLEHDAVNLFTCLHLQGRSVPQKWRLYFPDEMALCTFTAGKSHALYRVWLNARHPIKLIADYL